jgi:hypothetical protein
MAAAEARSGLGSQEILERQLIECCDTGRTWMSEPLLINM